MIPAGSSIVVSRSPFSRAPASCHSVGSPAMTSAPERLMYSPWASTSRIAIRAAGAAGIAASGEGHWKGVASVNVGEFHAKADAVSSPVFVLREGSDGCAVALERRGPYLLANDNERCGGHNVRFVGIYIRQTVR